MTRRDIEPILRNIESWKKAARRTQNQFCKQMSGRQYGWDALIQAWGWYVAGWKDRSK